MTVKYLVCSNCRQVIARFDPARLDSPLRGDMFESHMADRGVPPPWTPDLEAQWMKCPMCPRRPWAEPEPQAIMVSDTRDGQKPYFHNVEAAPPPPPPPPPAPHQAPSPGESVVEEGFLCERCGRSFKSPQGLAGHKRACQGG